MLITVQYTTQLKAALGVAQEQIQLDDDATLSKLMDRLIQDHGSTFADLVLTGDGQWLPSIVVCVDDRQLTPNQDVKLDDGSQVMFLSAISGG